jgi:hypothetical protein
MLGKWSSRKLLVAVGSVLTAVMVNVGLPEQIAANITDAVVWIASAFLVGQGAADTAAALKR